MQEQSNQTSPIAPNAKPYNILSILQPLIALDLIDEFKKSLIMPVGLDILITCLEVALKHQAEKVITYLSDCQFSAVDGNSDTIKKWVIGDPSRRLFNLMYLEYAGYFRSTEALQRVRSRFLEKIRTHKNKKLLLAVISGDIDTLNATAEIPEKCNSYLQPFIVYAAANNQAAVVNHLIYSRQHDPHSHWCNANAMLAAITQDAKEAFDILIHTAFNPNLEGLGSLLAAAVKFHRLTPFKELVKKGAIITPIIFRSVIDAGDESIMNFCCTWVSTAKLLALLSSLDFDTLSKLIETAPAKSFDKISLCLLCGCSPKLHSICLQRITNNTPRKLFILAHILTYYAEEIAQPAQVKTIFEKAFTELARLEYNDAENFEQMLQTHGKEFLLPILKIRLELVKLFTEDFKALESQISKISTQDEHFVSRYEAIALEITCVIAAQLDLNLSTAFLDQIEQKCVKSAMLSLTSSATQTSPSSPSKEGKRAADNDLTNPFSTTKRSC